MEDMIKRRSHECSARSCTIRACGSVPYVDDAGLGSESVSRSC